MSARDFIKTQKFGFLGCGNLGQAVIRAFIDSKLVPKENIYVSNRTEKKLDRIVEELGVNKVKTNEELIEKSNIVIIGVKPQDFYQAIEPIASSFHADHTVMSLAAGISLSALQKLIRDTNKIVRIMPNTAAKIQKSVIAYAINSKADAQMPWIEELLSSMGLVVPVEDGEMMESVVVAASSGIGFVFELMIYWKEWLEERGIDPSVAKKITLKVFAGAAALGDASETVSLDEQLRKVTSLKGVTAAGLDSMRELEIERALRISFEKAALRDRELGHNWNQQR